jgi:Protein of unknown function (DUF1573)
MCHCREWITILLVNAVACGCNYAKNQNQAEGGTTSKPATNLALKVKDNTPPQLAVENTSHDFKRMDQQKIGSHVFEMRNEGPGDLLLRIQHTSCGCTSVKLGDVVWDPKNPAPKTVVTVMPGGKIGVEMDWDTGERTGEFKTAANIESNDPKQPVVVFSVQGEIVPYVEVTESNVRIDEVRNGEVTTARTHMYSKKFDDLELTEFNSSNPLVTAEFEPADQVFLDAMKAKSGVTVTINVQPGVPIGPFAASITFKTNKEERPEVTVNVVGHVLGAVLLSPFEKLDFGIVSVSQEKTMRIFVKITGDEPVEVKVGKVVLVRPDLSGKGENVPVEPGILKVDLVDFKEKKNYWQLKVQVPQGSPGGQFKGVIELETTHPTAKIVKIPVRFEVSRPSKS